MYYTYVLINEGRRKTYTGYTSNLEKRLKVHNMGEVKSSSAYKPYKLLFVEEFLSKKEAKKRELFYKSRTGRRRLKQIIEDNRPSKC